MALPDGGEPALTQAADGIPLADWIGRLKPGWMRTALGRSLARSEGPPVAFLLEAELDHAYLQEWIIRLGNCLPTEDLRWALPIGRQEADIFHLRLVARARRQHEGKAGSWMRFHVRGTRLSRPVFASMLESEDSAAVVRGLAEAVLAPAAALPTGAPAEVLAILERQAWFRFGELANRAFRGSPGGLAVVIGYVGLRRLEVARLITLAEGSRLGLPAEILEARLTTNRGSRPPAYA